MSSTTTIRFSLQEKLYGKNANPFSIINCTKKKRRTQAPFDKESARPFAEDIAQWIAMIANVPAETCNVRFYALDLTQVPPCRPEEVNIFSVVARLEALEKSERDRVNLPPASQAPGAVQPPPPHPPRQQHNGYKVGDDLKESWTDVVSKNKARKKAKAKKEVREAAKNLRVVVGKADCQEVTACPPLKHLFVYKVARDCTPEITQ